MEVSVKKLDPRAKLPVYGSSGAGGADLYALLPGELTIDSGETVLIHTGLAMAIPEGFVGLIFARSGLATKRGLAPANKVGVIDSDYRGEVMVALYNHSSQPQTISDGERVAQLIVSPVLLPVYAEVDELEETSRGEGGFGSTGRR